MRGNAVPANYIKRHVSSFFRASRPTTLTLCARLKATRLWSNGAEFSLVVEKSYRPYKHLSPSALLLAHVILDDGVAAGEPVFLPQPIRNPLGCVTLLTVLADVVAQPLV